MNGDFITEYYLFKGVPSIIDYLSVYLTYDFHYRNKIMNLLKRFLFVFTVLHVIIYDTNNLLLNSAQNV